MMAHLNWSNTPKSPLIVDGATLEYACYGPAPDQAPTIVMLHEGLGCLALWRDFPERVAAATGMGVFVYSRQGYGQSDPVELPRSIDFMTHEATNVLPQILNQMGFQRGILFGHSDGATISAIYAGSLQDHRVRGLILMAPHFFTEPGGLAEIAKSTDAFETGGLREKMQKYHRDADGAFYGWNRVWLDPQFKAWNVAEAIDFLRIPTLAIQGRDDQYGTLAQIQEIDDRSYSPVDIEILDDCQHAPHLEQPEKTLAAITDFTICLNRIEAEQVKVA
ncbi:MAG: pimeloyl-ACP methyl ester carboxylesterase [Paracoccaceae bacterium]|jgi:pimeloyl-ACP methyl ester carboxylesterase